MRQRPVSLEIHAYNVGFGDCFLLSFDYVSERRHALIDFGSAARHRLAPRDLLLQVARDIERQCRGKLHAVVATHRHRDHINGFAGKPGRIIAGLNPEVIVQPWTEDPTLSADATAPVSSGRRALREFVASLQNMELVAQQVSLAVANKQWDSRVTRQLEILSEDNIPNREAIANLWKMGRRHCFVSFGSPDPLRRVLPGVRTRVLGPPTLAQSEVIRQRRRRDENEFWHFQARATGVGRTTRSVLFPAYRARTIPADAHVFLEQLRKGRGDQLLSLVRTLDAALNNTSVILLIEAGSKKLLFPGDAQIENWSFALQRAPGSLRDVDVYKVGHHGSLNATPKTLWELLNKRSSRAGHQRLTTLLSTLPGTHGDPYHGTEVPRSTLVAKLSRESRLLRTDQIGRALSSVITLEM